jgi:hypothetical protein
VNFLSLKTVITQLFLSDIPYYRTSRDHFNGDLAAEEEEEVLDAYGMKVGAGKGEEKSSCDLI